MLYSDEDPWMILSKKQWKKRYRELENYKKDINYLENLLILKERQLAPNSTLTIQFKKFSRQIYCYDLVLQNLLYNLKLHEYGLTEYMNTYPVMLDKVHYCSEEELTEAIQKFRIGFNQFSNHIKCFFKDTNQFNHKHQDLLINRSWGVKLTIMLSSFVYAGVAISLLFLYFKKRRNNQSIK